jgi:hypothetical protein
MKFDHQYGSRNGLPRHLEETLSSPKKCLLELALAKGLLSRSLVAKINDRRQFSTFPQGSALFWLKKTNW